jgi:hypothetical protein
MASISIWLDGEATRLYVRLLGRMDNRDFPEQFLRPLQILGFRFDPVAVAHFIEISSSQECSLLVR